MVSNPQPEPVDVPHKVGLRTFPIKLHELLFFICMPTRDAKQFWKKKQFQHRNWSSNQGEKQRFCNVLEQKGCKHLQLQLGLNPV